MSRLSAVAVAAAALSLTISGCSNDGSQAQSASRESTRADSAGGLVMAPTTPYKPTDANPPTALVVTLAGDSTTAPASSVPGCTTAGSEAAPETVFWVDGIREGKRLPEDRRYELVSSACGLEPRIQGTVIGGAINVFNDAGTHRLVFVRAGTTDTLQTMPFTNSGSIVATDRLTKTAGIVEVRCAQHPQERAYIAVFDHPYFGVARGGSRVTLDSVPAGDYRVITWHEGMPTPSTTPTKVAVSGQTEIILKQ